MTTSQTVSFQVGDRVMYARAFLRSTGMISGWAPFACGTVQSAEYGLYGNGQRALVQVLWDGFREAQPILDCNLIHTNRAHLEPV